MNNRSTGQKPAAICCQQRIFRWATSERKALPAGSEIGMEATSSQYRVWITLPSEGVRYVLNHEGRFQIEKL